MSHSIPKVVIVGGGISGLSTAYYLQKLAKENKISVDIVLLEENATPGGKIQTEVMKTEQGRFVIEAGPDAMLATKPMAKQLAEELGIFEGSIGTNIIKNTLYVWRKGKLHAVPKGMYMIVPTDRWAVMKSSLFSWSAKWRLVTESLVPSRKRDDDESLYDFINRRFGEEVANVLGIPLMAGIYNADPKRQSMNTTFRQFIQMEQQHGSLTKAFQIKTSSSSTIGSPFFSFTSGVSSYTDTLVAALKSVTIQTSCKVERITRKNKTYEIQSDHGIDTADVVVLSTPAAVSSHLVSHLDSNLAGVLARQRTVSTGTITLAYPSQNIQKPIDGFGILFPSTEQRTFNAVTISSIKFIERAPQGYELIRLFFGGHQKQHQLGWSDETLLQAAMKELQEILCISGAPIFHKIFRWYNAAPQYEVGHEDWLKEIHRLTPSGIHLNGSAFKGIGIPDCVNQSHFTAKRIIQNFLE